MRLALLLVVVFVGDVAAMAPSSLRVVDADSPDDVKVPSATDTTTEIHRRFVPISIERGLLWSDFLYPLLDDTSLFKFGFESSSNADVDLPPSQQIAVNDEVEHATPPLTDDGGWAKFWRITF